METFTCTFRKDYPASKPLGRITIDETGVTFSWPLKDNGRQKEWSRHVDFDQIESFTCQEITQNEKLGDKLGTYLLWLVGTCIAAAVLTADLLLHLNGQGVLSLGWDIILLLCTAAFMVPRMIRARRSLKRYHGCILKIEVKSSDPMIAAGFDEDIENIMEAGRKLKEAMSGKN
jgi:hypothetical protein